MIIIYLCHFCYHFTCYGLQKRTLKYSINWKHGSFIMAMMMQIIRNERLCMTWWYKLMWVVFWNSTCHSDENMIRNYTIEIVKWLIFYMLFCITDLRMLLQTCIFCTIHSCKDFYDEWWVMSLWFFYQRHLRDAIKYLKYQRCSMTIND